MKCDDGVCVELKPRVHSVNVTLVEVNEDIRDIRIEIEDIVLGLDSLPEGLWIHFFAFQLHIQINGQWSMIKL